MARKLKLRKGSRFLELAYRDSAGMADAILWSDPFQWVVMRDKTTHECTWGGNPRGVWCSH